VAFVPNKKATSASYGVFYFRTTAIAGRGGFDCKALCVTSTQNVKPNFPAFAKISQSPASLHRLARRDDTFDAVAPGD
jgi:hypothetical protein